MAGLAQVFLTDKELELLVRWGELAEAQNGSDKERHLLGKLRGQANAVSCKACTSVSGAEGETCAIPLT